ncbi:hypothetical protein PV08_06501 [Exophiala spinifera]|uniref:Uncharacterized protein n=1 Tax=Exophiala spinifera TaxID=91928 RepID=A0A0D2BBR6_9EURO|nr:uncharacterized protein PV08_06501 [Exophiala spinifera]KIW16448.1 hypothetical protein PV08_06501 [Exophiala spinifera]
MSHYVSKFIDSISDGSASTPFNTVNGGYSRGHGQVQGQTQVLLLRQSPFDPNLILIHPSGYPVEAPPLYTAISSQERVSVYRGAINPANLMGVGSRKSISLYGHGGCTIAVKTDHLSGDFKLKYPPGGKGSLKWKTDSMSFSSSSSLKLVDGSGQKIARLKKHSSEKRLEIYVPCDEHFLNVVILSGLAVRLGAKKNDRDALEVVQAMSGS